MSIKHFLRIFERWSFLQVEGALSQERGPGPQKTSWSSAPVLLGPGTLRQATTFQSCWGVLSGSHLVLYRLVFGTIAFDSNVSSTLQTLRKFM